MNDIVKALQGKKTYLMAAAKALLGACLALGFVDWQHFLVYYAFIDAGGSAALRAGMGGK